MDKTAADKLKEELFSKRKNGYFRGVDDGRISALSKDYIDFLNTVKTERESVDYFIGKSASFGFQVFDPDKTYSKGEGVYCNNRGKALTLIKFGKRPLSDGVTIIAAHIDSPRIDLKQNPLYEDSELCYLKTHYYGGIKKYQWMAVPLSLRGVVVLADESKITMNIGEKEGDPQFVINDLLPHLAADQYKKTAGEIIAAEDMNVLAGSRPYNDDKASDAVKLNILNILKNTYGITEPDLVSAELCLVPANRAAEIGFDRSMIGGYGQDDRVCAYLAARCIMDCDEPEYTSIVILADKEEIGSDGNTGLNSNFLFDIISDLADSAGVPPRRILQKSICLSADVCAAFDPNFAAVYEKRNSAFINRGTAIMKYTGARGKSDTSDASAEFMGYVRRVLDEEGVLWQTTELGAVDKGGGGTVAKYVAALSVDTIDIGVPVLSMHSPFEITSKLDLYSTGAAFSAFLKRRGGVTY